MANLNVRMNEFQEAIENTELDIGIECVEIKLSVDDLRDPTEVHKMIDELSKSIKYTDSIQESYEDYLNKIKEIARLYGDNPEQAMNKIEMLPSPQLSDYANGLQFHFTTQNSDDLNRM